MINSSSFIPNDCSLLERSLEISRAQYDWTSSPIEDLYEYYNDENAITQPETYERYWHGYIILLRPLLMLLDLSGIRFVYCVTHFILLFMFIRMLEKKANLSIAISFLVTYLCFSCYVIPLSLQYSHIFFIMLISGMILMKFNDKFKQKRWTKYFFLLIGIVTVYFDLLTYPIITLGINLILYILINKEINIKDIIVYIIMWFVGYGGMWFMKWVIASLVLNENVFENAYNAIITRTNSNHNFEIITLSKVFDANLSYLKHRATLITFLVDFVANVIIAFKENKKNLDLNVNKLVSFIIIFVLPILWLFILKEHSYTHSQFVFRILMIDTFAILALPQCMIKSKA